MTRAERQVKFGGLMTIPQNAWGVLKKSLGSFVEAYLQVVLRACIANDLKASKKIARPGASGSVPLH